MLESRGWARSLILLLRGAAPPCASSSPSVKWAHLTVRTDGDQKTENHLRLKVVDSGARLLRLPSLLCSARHMTLDANYQASWGL